MFDLLAAHLDKKEYTVLTGARQTGKSTLLRQLETYCKERSIPCVFLNLENRDIFSTLNEQPLNVLRYLPDTTERVVVFIDEVQYLDDPSNFLKLLYDEHAMRVKIVATGSSAFYIDDHFRDSLAGRKRVFQLLTCSFREHLQLTQKGDLLQELDRIQAKEDAKTTHLTYLRQEWETYILFGGYPAVITEPKRKEKIVRLRDIRDSFIKRDIIESGVQNEVAFHHLFRLLAEQSGSLVNVNELSNTLRIRSETVNNYLHILQKCFHVALIKPYSQNLRKELTKMPKAYLLDTGLRNCLLNDFQDSDLRSDKGELWESVYFRGLAERYDLESIFFWRTADGNEVDFVLPEKDEPVAIEVKFDEAQIKPGKYKKFVEAYPGLPLKYAWVRPFDENFFRRLRG
jgi:predicted AAA+ superfamily ATPase